MPSMNEWDVDDAVNRFGRSPDCENLYLGAKTLERLVRWTNSNSDGWPYWRKPSAAAARLQALLEGADRFDPSDCTAANLKRAYAPIKAFLTRHFKDKPDEAKRAHDYIFEVGVSA